MFASLLFIQQVREDVLSKASLHDITLYYLQNEVNQGERVEEKMKILNQNYNTQDNWVKALHRWQNVSPSWRLIGVISLVLFSFGILIIIRPDTTTNRFISTQTGIQIDFLAGFFLIASAFVWVLYYFIRNLFAVLVSLMPLVLAIFYLVIQIAQSSTAPLFHLGTSVWFLALLLVIFYGAGELEEERQLQSQLQQRNYELSQQLRHLTTQQKDKEGE